MLLVECPHCGRRPEVEFRYAGEAHIARPPDPSATDDATWTAYLYERTNSRGSHRERWRHMGCGRFFNAARDTTTDGFTAVYPIGGAAPRERGTP